MPNVETLVWVLGGVMTVISTLGGIIWTMIRAEAAKQAEEIQRKVDVSRLHEAEQRWAQELNMVRDGSEKLVNKLEVRHDKEMEQMASRLGEQLRSTEQNILTQIRLMIEVLKTDRNTVP